MEAINSWLMHGNFGHTGIEEGHSVLNSPTDSYKTNLSPIYIIGSGRVEYYHTGLRSLLLGSGDEKH